MNHPAEKNKRSCLTNKGSFIRFAVFSVYVIAIALLAAVISSCDSTESGKELNEAEEKAQFESMILSLLKDEIDSDGNVIRQWDCSDLKISYLSQDLQSNEHGWTWNVEGTYSTEIRKEKGTFYAMIEVSDGGEFGTRRTRFVEMINDKGESRSISLEMLE